MANILTSYPIIQDLVLPFILIFVLVFAILERSKLLGDGKKQINAIMAFVVAGIFLAFSNYVLWIKQFSIVLVISLVVLFVFLLIWGFVWGDRGGDPLKESIGLKWTIGIVFLIIILISALKITGYIDKLNASGTMVSNIIFAVLIIAAVVVVLNSGKKEDKK